VRRHAVAGSVVRGLHEHLQERRHPIALRLEDLVERLDGREEAERRIAGFGETIEDGPEPVVELLGQRHGDERVLRSEVIGDRRQVRPGEVGDRPRGRVRRPAGAEAFPGRRDKAVAGAGGPPVLGAPLGRVDHRVHTNV